MYLDLVRLSMDIGLLAGSRAAGGQWTPVNLLDRDRLLRGAFCGRDRIKVNTWLDKIEAMPYSHFLLDFHQLAQPKHRICANILEPLIRMPAL